METILKGGTLAAAIALILSAGCRTAGKPRHFEPSQPVTSSVAQPQPAEQSRPELRLPSAAQAQDSLATSAAAGDRGSAGDHRAVLVAAKVELASHALEPSASPAAPLSLTLDDAIMATLERNPSLIALRAGEPVAHAAYHVAEKYPFNPIVQVQVLPYSRDRAGETLAVNNSVSLVQTLELAHQRRHRETSAAAAWDQVRWNIVQAELAGVAHTEQLYFAVLYQRELRDLARQAAALNEDLLGVVQRRFEAGLATAAEQTTSRVITRQSRKQAALAEANYQTALLALRRQLNSSADEPVIPSSRLEEFAWLPVAVVERQADADVVEDATHLAVWDQLAAELADQRPDVMAAEAGLSTAEANADLARANRIQNVGVGPFYERDESGTVMAGLRTQMSLPIWDTGRALLQQREAEFQQQMTALEQLRLRARVEAQTAIQRYERARQLTERERRDFSQTIADDLSKIKAQFEAGQADILNVYAAQNSLLQERRAYLDLLNELAQAAAEVTLATGLPPARLITTASAEPSAPEPLPTPEPKSDTPRE